MIKAKMELPDRSKSRLNKIRQVKDIYLQNVRQQLMQVGQDAARYIRTGIERQVKQGRVYKLKGSGANTKLAGAFTGDVSSLKQTPGGRISNAKRGGRLYRASAPGQFAGIVSGKMIRSLHWEAHGSGFIEIGFDQPHAKYLEEGTAQVASRPSLKRGITEVQGRSFNYLKWETILKGEFK